MVMKKLNKLLIFTCESTGTRARIRISRVFASASVLANVIRAVIDVLGAVLATEARLTLASGICYIDKK